MRLAQERGSQWLQEKREEANLASVKANSLLADSSCEHDELQEEMRLAQERGSQWLQEKREEANLASVKANSLLQTATRTEQKLVQKLAPNAKLVQRTVGTFQIGAAKSKEKQLKKPTFNPFMPNTVSR